MYKTKKALNASRKFLQAELKLFAQEVRKAGLTMRTTLYLNEDVDKKGKVSYRWYINTCYSTQS